MDDPSTIQDSNRVTTQDSNGEKQLGRLQLTVKWIIFLNLAIIGGGFLFTFQFWKIKEALTDQATNVSRRLDDQAVNVSKRLDEQATNVSLKFEEIATRVDDRVGGLEKILSAATPASRRAAAFRRRLEAQATEFQRKLETQVAVSLQRFEVLAERIEKAPALNSSTSESMVIAASPPLPLTEDDKAIIRRDLRLEGPAPKGPPKFLIGQRAPEPPKPIPPPLLNKLPKLRDLRFASDPITGSALLVDRADIIVAIVSRVGG
jgi:hypothetical protein